MSMHARLARCRSRASGFLERMAVDRGAERYWRHSATHDPEAVPGHLLYGTWAGVLMARLIGDDAQLAGPRGDRLRRGLQRFRTPDGFHVMPLASAGDRGGHDEEYFALHCTNYTLGALRALDAAATDAGEPIALPTAYLAPLLEAEGLARWLERRDWRDPWQEGNNVVNLASLFAEAAEQGDARAAQRLAQMAEWHDRNQHPRTGFWHEGDATGWAPLLQAMAGAAHDLHIYYYLGRPVPNADRVVDSCLRLGYLGVRSACIDIDLVDVLVHCRRYGHRVAEIDAVLERYLVELLDLQHADGGFGDSYVEPQVTYGLATPVGASVMWTSWFRMATIGMAACALLSGERRHWRFRDSIGMGYARLDDLGVPPSPRWMDGRLATGYRWRLAVQREGRFYRQRATLHARRWLGAVR